MKRGDLLNTAKKHVTGGREQDHGKPEDTFPMIAALWTAYLNVGLITPDQVAMMMALLKIARSRANPANEDNYVDLAGYASCASELSNGTMTELERLLSTDPR